MWQALNSQINDASTTRPVLVPTLRWVSTALIGL